MNTSSTGSSSITREFASAKILTQEEQKIMLGTCLDNVRKTNVELVETMWEQFCNLGIYESNVIETTTYSIQEAVFAVKEKISSGAALLS